MKNFKFLSALALTGMLSAGIVGASLASETKPIGVFKSGTLVDDTTVVPFVLENKNDKITVDAIKKAYPTATDIKGDTEGVVGTGTTFKVGNETYTAVVYGDVNGDGKVTTQDATQVQIESTTKNKLNAVQKEAGDVKRAGELRGISTIDAVNIQRFAVGSSNVDIDEPPVAPEEVETKFAVELKDQYVNNVNESAVEANIVIPNHDNELETKKKVKLVIVNADGKNGATLKNTKKTDVTYTIPAHTSSVPITFDATQTNNKIPEGITTLRLVSEDGKEILAEFTIDKHTKEIANLKVTDQKATRDGLSKGTISFNTYGTYNGKPVNAKALYYVYNSNSTISKFNVATANKIDITDNKVEGAVVNGLTKVNPYNIFYVLEDEYGSRTTSTGSALNTVLVTIPTDLEASKKTVPEIEEVVSPDLDKETDINTAAYTWKVKKHSDTDDSSTKTVISLYKDGKLVATKEVNSTTTSIVLNQFKDEKNKNIMETAGTYKISVYVKGTANAPASETKWSDEKIVSPLTSVTDVKFTTNLKNEKTLSWESEAYKDTPRAVAGYKVELAVYDDSKKEFGDYSSGVTTVDSDKFSTTNLNITSGTMYKARVTVLAKQDKPLSVVDSEPTESKEFIYTNLEYDSSTADTIKMKVSPAIKFTGKTTKYKVQVWEYNTAEAGGITEGIVGQEPIEVKDITVNSATGAFEVTGLDNSKTYAFRVVADVDGVEGITNFVGNIGMKKTMPDITKLKVVKTQTEANENEISVLGAGLSINGVDYKDLTQYPAELATVKEIVSKLSEGDILTYTSEKTIVELGTLSDSRDLTGLDLSKTTLELQGDDHNRTITTTGAKEIILSAKEGETTARFNTSKMSLATDGRLVVNDKVYLTTPATQDIVIGTGAKVNFNKIVDVKSSKETKVKYAYAGSKATITVEPTTEANELTFNSEKDIDVIISGDSSNTQTQNGSIVITAKGNVKVSGSQGMNVNSDITVDATNGNVTLNAKELSGKQNVTVKTDKKSEKNNIIYAKSETPSPVTLSNFALRKYNYSVPEDKKILDGLKTASGELYLVPGEDEKNNEKITAFNEFVTSFLGEEDQGAKITVAAGKQEVTITLPKVSDTFEVGGLLEGNN